MAFIATEYLEQGNVEFLTRMTESDINRIIFDVRNSSRRKNIVASIIPKIEEVDSYFIFEIIYDMEEYQELSKKLMIENKITISYEKLANILNNTSFGLNYLNDNFDSILQEHKENPEFIFDYIFDNYQKCQNLINKLKIYPDLHIRSLFMSYLLEYKPKKIAGIYDDMTRYLTSVTYATNEQLSFTPTLMEIDDVCRIANAAFMAKKMILFEKLKKYIFENYPTNNLAELLLCGIFNPMTFSVSPNKRGIKEFKSDADRYFKTASNWRLQILKNYSKDVSIELLEEFKKKMLLFQKNNQFDPNLEHLDAHGLTRLLEEYVDKYLSVSKDKTYEFIGEGTTASCYRIGDYSFKLIKTKWSYENVICPNLYLILSNLEEYLIRNKTGVVQAGIEVQKFLKRDAKEVPTEIFKLFKDELNRLGYYSTDSLINGECGDNTRLLDSYLEAGTDVPDWFKEYPLVLVDRDRIYRLENKHPKQRVLHIDY